MITSTQKRPGPRFQSSPADRQLHDRSSLLATIGNTPLIRIRNIAIPNERVQIYAKAEWFNPGGSIKDRAALRMIRAAEKAGTLTRHKTIIDATSGNTGIAYAMIGSVLGYSVQLALPANATPERQHLLRSYGAAIIETDPLEGTDGAQRIVKEIVTADPDLYYYPDQYNNPLNWKAHYITTAPEIWEQSGHRVTHFVAGLGTTGTFVGTTRRLKELHPGLVSVAVQPDSPLHGIEGLKHLPTAQVPGIYDPLLPDEHVTVSTEEAFDMTRQLVRCEGLYAGISSGAALAASLRLAEEIDEGVIVTIFPDGGSRYASERFWFENR